jgi:hypothetical protein
LHLRGFISLSLLPALLESLESPASVILTNFGTMLAAVGSMEPPATRLGALISSVKEVHNCLVNYSEKHPTVPVKLLPT